MLNRHFLPLRPSRTTTARLVGLVIIVFLSLSAGPALTAPGTPGPSQALKLGLVDNQPRPGHARLPLEGRVSEIRHDYGHATLVRLTQKQVRALREAGHRVRIFKSPAKVSIGFYSFRVPPGPTKLPHDLMVDESSSKRGTYLVKLIGPARDEWLAELRSRGAEILTPVPTFTYLVRGHPKHRGSMASLPFVEWVGAYHPAFKLSPDLARRAEQGSLSTEAVKLNVLVYRSGDPGSVINQVRGMGGILLERSIYDFYEQILIAVSEEKLLDLARNSDVYVVERYLEPELEDESATQILGGNYTPAGIPLQPGQGQATYNDWLTLRNLNGSNVTIGYADDGVLDDDPSDHLDGRVNDTVCADPGSDGHGHFGASAAGGFCNHPAEASTGFLFGVGVAPAVNFISIPFLRSTGACNATLQTRAELTVSNTGPNGQPGTIQNNSWGAGRGDSANDVTYSSFERDTDLLVRDADSGTSGNQELITCFSAGNEGNTTIGALNGDSPATLTRPHGAKNVITTGCSEVWRPTAGGSNINNRCLFSSQGPTFDGRWKPDVMAPGGVEGNYAALSSASVNGFGFAVDSFHSLSAGTSFSTPETAGGSALLVQWWERFASAVPSPALTRAFLINSARDMQGGNTPRTTPNRHEGWGRWNLGNVIEPGTPTVVPDGLFFKKTSGLDAIYLDQSVIFQNNGDSFVVHFVPDNPSQPVRATLAWTDAPGAIDSCPSLVNDLDLELIQNGNIVLPGNAFSGGLTVPDGPIDSVNNVEQVIQNSPSGFYTLRVLATTLAGDGVPGNGDATDQDFALVLLNAVPYNGPIMSAGALTMLDDCAGTGSGNDSVIDPGETVTVTVPLVNSGDQTATAVSATLTTAPASVTILDGSSAYPDIPVGTTQAPADTMSFALSDTASCGAVLNLDLDVSTSQGSFTVPLRLEVGSRTLSTQNLSGSTGVVEDDVTIPTDFTTPSAATGTIRDVSLDVDITSTGEFLFNDYNIQLKSAQNTTIILHRDPLPCFDLVHNYPGDRLPMNSSFDALVGEDAGGIWTLRVIDNNNTELVGGGPKRPASEATVNSWTVNITTESGPACNTCTVTAPPEVSSPGSVDPLLLDFDSVAGTVDFAWEDLGTLADSYRLYQGNILDLPEVGVTTTNTAPIQCGIVGPGTSLVPNSGDLFYLVAGQKGALMGPLGEATDPITFPRNANQTCP